MMRLSVECLIASAVLGGCAPPDDGDTVSGDPRDEGAPAAVVGDDAKLQRLEQGACSALAPEGWSLLAASPYWAADLPGPGGRAYGGWGILYVDRAMEGWYADSYGDLYGDPAASMAYVANAIIAERWGGGNMHYTSEAAAVGQFGYRFFEAPSASGMVIFRLFGADAGAYVEGQSYIESMYFALAATDEWAASWGRIALTAASIRCVAEYRSPAGGTANGEGDDRPDDEDYNAILGTQYVHDRNCTNYLVSDVQWSESGPEGAGYYREVPGGEYELLTPGRCD